MIDFFYGVLQSLGYTHPVHVMVTHMPVGLVTGAFALQLIALLFAREGLKRSARHAFTLALIFAVPTVVFGIMDWFQFYNGAWVTAIRVKIVLASILLVLLVAGFFLGRPGKMGPTVMLVLYALSFLTVVGLGYYGANLVFGESVGAAAPAPAPQAVSRSPQDLQAGASIFAANCQPCHPSGANVVVPSLPLKASKKLASLESFVAFVRDPKMPDGSVGEMPPFGKGELDERQAGRLYAYILDMNRKGWR